MNKQERIIEAEKAIEMYQKDIENSKMNLEQWQQKLADLKKQSEPKDGEWWYMQTYEGEDKGQGDSKGVLRIKSVSGLRAYYTEHYDEINGYFNDYLRLDQPVFRPATTEEITYFMGLHAERSGLVYGATVEIFDNYGNTFTWKLGQLEKYEFSDGQFLRWSMDKKDGIEEHGGLILRNKESKWATVVKDKPKPVKNGKLKAKITELQKKVAELEAKNIQYVTALKTINSETSKYL